jgi:hypothetical protein
MWRGWFMHNNVIFGKGRKTITGSAKFLMSYSESLSGISKQGKRGIEDKGKSPMHSLNNEALKRGVKMEVRRNQERWAAPMSGWVKLNTDVAYCWDNGRASTGIVVHDDAYTTMLGMYCLLHGWTYGIVALRRKRRHRNAYRV